MVRAFRGATTIEENTAEAIRQAAKEMTAELLERNGIDKEDLVSIIFTVTPDITAAFPASGVREMGICDVPLLDMAAPAIDNMLPMCIRVMIYAETELGREKIEHVYLNGAVRLRPDLVK